MRTTDAQGPQEAKAAAYEASILAIAIVTYCATYKLQVSGMPLSSDLLSAQRGRRYALNKVRLKKSQTVARPCGFLAQRFDQILIVADVIDVVRHQRKHET